MKTENVKVFFKYEKNDLGQRVINGKIEAVAMNTETKQELARREVRPRHGDVPNKELGRKYAFKKLMTHVMDNNILPKPMVGDLWKQFGSMCRQPNQKLAY